MESSRRDLLRDTSFLCESVPRPDPRQANVNPDLGKKEPPVREGWVSMAASSLMGPRWVQDCVLVSDASFFSLEVATHPQPACPSGQRVTELEEISYAPSITSPFTRSRVTQALKVAGAGQRGHGGDPGSFQQGQLQQSQGWPAGILRG